MWVNGRTIKKAGKAHTQILSGIDTQVPGKMGKETAKVRTLLQGKKNLKICQQITFWRNQICWGVEKIISLMEKDHLNTQMVIPMRGFGKWI